MTRPLESATVSEGSPMIVFWRRTDVEGLERLALIIGANGVQALSTVICVEDGGFRLDHEWELTPDWRAVSLWVERLGVDGRRALALEREGSGWRVNGQRRPDLEGVDEPDLSVTPFCNTLPMRRILGSQNASIIVDTAYVNGKDLTVTRSRQRYENQGRNRIRYVDLGLFPGFEADLQVDDLALVLHYQHLFERVAITT
jgi:uncharacterized protein